MPLTGDYEEKRDFARMGLACTATFHIDGEGTTYQAEATDLSATGLQLRGDEAIAIGAILLVEVTPEQTILPPLQATAEVVRCVALAHGQYRLGLHILKMQPGL